MHVLDIPRTLFERLSSIDGRIECEIDEPACIKIAAPMLTHGKIWLVHTRNNDEKSLSSILRAYDSQEAALSTAEENEDHVWFQLEVRRALTTGEREHADPEGFMCAVVYKVNEYYVGSDEYEATYRIMTALREAITVLASMQTAP